LGATQELQGLADPNSQFFSQQRDRSQEAVRRQLAAQGLLRSTAQGDQLSNIEVGLEQNRAQILSSLAGNGASQAFAQTSGNMANAANQFGQNEAAQGNVLAQGFLNQGQIGSNLATQFTNIGGGILDQMNAERLREQQRLQQQAQMSQTNAILSGLIGGGGSAGGASSVSFGSSGNLGFGVSDNFNATISPRLQALFGGGF